jgi:hypothetical protein
MDLLCYTVNGKRGEGAGKNRIRLTALKTWNKKIVKKIYFTNPNDFSVTSVFTAPTW